MRNPCFLKNGNELAKDSCVGTLPERTKWIVIRIARFGPRLAPGWDRAFPDKWNATIRARSIAFAVFRAAFGAVQHALQVYNNKSFSSIPTRCVFLRFPGVSLCRMSATFTSTWAARLTPGLRFSGLMTDDAKSISSGLKQRDPELLDLLIEQYQFRLFRYLLYLTGSRERAEDFFQETWVRVLERGSQYDGKWKFEAWLFTIARNLVLDWHRRKKPQSLESLGDPEGETSFDVKDEKSATPLESFLEEERREGIQNSLAKIPVAYREVLVLRFQEEMQLEEIAGVLSAPISTVKSRLYRGLEALRGAMTGGAV